MKIFHLALEAAWNDAQATGVYAVSTLGLDVSEVGFMHCSQAEQVDGVFEKYYTAVTEPIIRLTIDTDLLSSPWQLDDVPGAELPFPHIYGPLDIDAVARVTDLREQGGTFRAPNP